MSNYGSGYPGAYVTLFEDFLTDNVTALVETAGGSAVQDINASSTNGGWWRQELAGDDGDDLILAGEVVWEVDEGQPLVFETRVKPSTVSAQMFGAGLSDANTESSGIAPIDAEGGTLLTTATDVVAIFCDESTAGTFDPTPALIGVSNGTDTETLANGLMTNTPDFTAGAIQVWRLELTTANSGTARAYIGTANEFGGGKLVKTVTGAFRSSVALCPYLSAEDRAVDTDVDWDYIYVQCPRT